MMRLSSVVHFSCYTLRFPFCAVPVLCVGIREPLLFPVPIPLGCSCISDFTPPDTDAECFSVPDTLAVFNCQPKPIAFNVADSLSDSIP